MKRIATVVSLLMVFTVAAILVSNPAMAQTRSEVQGVGTDSNPIGPPSVIIPAKYQVSGKDAAGAAAAVVSGTAVYFTPQDENTSATVLFIYNTNKVDKIIGLQTFDLTGALVIDTTMTVPSFHMIRICSDTVTTISATWADYVLVNFTTFSTYAKLTLPGGVKADGYVVYNPSGIYDPLTEAQMLPLRFSVRAPTVP